jgi:hypothetical protein
MNKPTRYMCHFDGEKLEEIKAWCKRKGIPLAELLRKALDNMWEKVKDR